VAKQKETGEKRVIPYLRFEAILRCRSPSTCLETLSMAQQISGINPVTRKNSFHEYRTRKNAPIALTSAAPKRTPVR